MAETVKIDIFADSSSIKELKQQLLEARNQLSGLEAGSEGFQNVARRAGELKDQMTDINEQVAIFAGGSKFEQAGTALGQVKDALFNLDFQGASDKAKALTTIISSISFKEATAGLGQLGSTFLSLGKALLTNPLFLIPAAIVGIITSLGLLGPIIEGVKNLFNTLSAAVSEFLDYIGITNTKLDETKKKQKEAAEEAKKHKDALISESAQFSIMIERLKNTNNGSKERKELIKDINSQYGTTLKNIKDEAKFQDAVNTAQAVYLEQLKNKFLLQSNEAKMQKVYATILNLEEKRAKLITQIEDPYQKDQNRLDYLKEQLGLVDLSISKNKDYFEQLGKIDQKIATSGVGLPTTIPTPSTTTDEVEAKKLSDDELYKLQQENLAKRNKAELDSLDIIDAAKKANTDMFLTDQELAIQKENEAYEIKLKNAKEFDQDTEALEIEHLNNLNNINLSAQQKDYAQKEQQKEKELRLAKEAADAQIAAEKALYDAKWGFANALVDGLSQLAGKNKKAADAIFLVQKGLAIAQIIVDTQKEIAGYASNPLWSALPDGGASLKIPAIAAAKIRAATSIATIAATSVSRFMNGGGGSSSGGGGGTAATPNAGTVTTPAQPSFQLFGTAGQANNVQAGTGEQVQTINVNASVSVDQITDTQKKLVQINQSKTL